jgi:hypothetical protein
MLHVELETFVRFEAVQIEARAATWLTPEESAANLRAEFGNELVLHSDPERAERFRQYCPVPGAVSGEYMLRALDLGRDGQLLAGIHFFAMDVRQPFVGVLARTEPLPDRAAVVRVGTQLQREFARFAPRHWRIWVGAHDLGVAATDGAQVDFRVIAGKLSELCARPALAAPLPVALEPCSAATIYPEYQALFARFFAAQPHWHGRIQVETLESLHKAETFGVLARARIAGEPAGFFAALPATERALRGYVVLEEILDAPFRGKRLAAPLQRLLLERIVDHAKDRHAIVFGHIAHGNEPSLRTAFAVGREEVYRTAFLPFA